MSGPLLPPALWEQLAAFLAAGNTGKIEISVTCGRITGYTVLASWRVAASEPDQGRVVDIGEGARRVQSPR